MTYQDKAPYASTPPCRPLPTPQYMTGSNENATLSISFFHAAPSISIFQWKSYPPRYPFWLEFVKYCGVGYWAGLYLLPCRYLFPLKSVIYCGIGYWAGLYFWPPRYPAKGTAYSIWSLIQSQSPISPQHLLRVFRVIVWSRCRVSITDRPLKDVEENPISLSLVSLQQNVAKIRDWNETPNATGCVLCWLPVGPKVSSLNRIGLGSTECGKRDLENSADIQQNGKLRFPVSCTTRSNANVVLVWICTEKSEFSVLADVFGGAFPVESIIRRAVQCGAVRCSAVQCSAVQCCAVRCGAVRCSAVQCSAVQCGAVQCKICAVQCGAVQCKIFSCGSLSSYFVISGISFWHSFDACRSLWSHLASLLRCDLGDNTHSGICQMTCSTRYFGVGLFCHIWRLLLWDSFDLYRQVCLTCIHKIWGGYH